MQNEMGQTFWDIFSKSNVKTVTAIIIMLYFCFSCNILLVYYLTEPCSEISVLGFKFKKQCKNANKKKIGVDPNTDIIISGSNTIGSRLMPEIIMKFMNNCQAKKIKKTTVADNHVKYSAIINGKSVSFVIISHGTSFGFNMLKNNECHIVMASREISKGEYHSLWKTFGDLTAYGREIVIALDGIAIIVHPSNPINSLSTSQVYKIFTGKVKYWKEVLYPKYDIQGLNNSQIKVFIRPKGNSGTFDVFAEKILGKYYDIPDNAEEIEDNTELSKKVYYSNKAAIGFVGYPFIRKAKSIAIYESDEKDKPITEAYKPNKRTIGLEKYLLSRRLYLYIPETIERNNNVIRQLVDFIHEISDIIEQCGYVDKNIIVNPKTSNSDDKDMSISELLISDSELSTLNQNELKYFKLKKLLKEPLRMFFFKSCSDLLDNKAMEDVVKVTDYILNNNSQKIYVFGHADNQGSLKVNNELANLRAETVANRLKENGINPSITIGLGTKWPIASNNSVEGRLKNRRVEIWIE